MTSDVTDMSTPVTRGELRDELAQLENRMERKFDDKLDLWGGALLARIAESEKRVLDELARHIRAAFESMKGEIVVLDDRYKDLPGRVTQLEVDVQALKQG